MAVKHTKEMGQNHRSRLRKRYESGGADSFDDYALMELILFDFIPRVDTYPTAHRLIDTFGSIEKVFSASKKELIKIEGIGPKTAEKLTLYGDVMDRAVCQRLSCVPFITENQIAPYLIWTFRALEVDCACLLLLDKDGYLTERNLFHPFENDEGSLLVSTQHILKTRKPPFAILAHKHPRGVLEPSGADLSVTNTFMLLCAEEGTTPLNHYIVTDTECVCIKRSH